MLSFLKPYIPKPLHPPSICKHDFLYIHPLIFKLCKALQAKLHEYMRHTDPPSTLSSRCESLTFTQPQSSGFILHIELLKKIPQCIWRASSICQYPSYQKILTPTPSALIHSDFFHSLHRFNDNNNMCDLSPSLSLMWQKSGERKLCTSTFVNLY